MSDDQLRVLERNWESTRDPETGLRLAAFYERLGQPKAARLLEAHATGDLAMLAHLLGELGEWKLATVKDLGLFKAKSGRPMARANLTNELGAPHMWYTRMDHDGGVHKLRQLLSAAHNASPLSMTEVAGEAFGPGPLLTEANGKRLLYLVRERQTRNGHIFHSYDFRPDSMWEACRPESEETE